MSKSLIIVESPAKARTIEKFLGGRRYTVRASMGHVRDLPKSQLGVDVDNGFEPKYITIRGKGDVLKELRDGARKADQIFLATDPDREGEAISWHLAQVLGLDDKAPLRIEFHEITKSAIQKAIKQARPIDPDRVEAQQARRILDRLVGYKLSPLLWRKVRRGLSAGRVQSAAVRLICDREAEIAAFVREEYWTITAQLLTQPGTPAFSARYFGINGTKAEIRSAEAAAVVAAAVQGASFVVTAVRRRERRRNPAFPFTTSSMQQEAARKLGFTVRRTMVVAQQLYEGLDLGEAGHTGLITYMRTDSTRIADEAVQAAAAYITGTFGADHLPEERREAEKRAGEQGAHEAVRPTEVTRTPDSVKVHLSQDQYRLYKLIWERFVSSQMAPAILDTVSVDIAANGSGFRASGSTLKFPGFMAVYIEGDDDESAREEEGLLPDLTEGQTLQLQHLAQDQHFTQPPPRYTEAMLVKALEERGIGRPSTYAPIIETIQQRGYVEKEEKRFKPTELGDRVVTILKDYFPSIIDVEFTAQMETELDQIADGQVGGSQVLSRFYNPFASTLKEAEEKIGGFELEDEVSEEVCEKCGRQMVIKYGRFGKFLACPGFPDCKNTRPILEDTGAICPQCHQGHLVERKSKRGGRKFYGCQRYPECDYVSWYKPVATPCPECSGLIVEKRTKGTLLHACTNESCGYSAEAGVLSEVET